MKTKSFLGGALTLLLAALVGCGGESPESDAGGSQSPSEPTRSVVLYTSADDYLVDQVVAVFEQRTGIDVLVVGDTEATKTVGLYQRLMNEKDAPRADVWWSSEPFYTVRLADEGVLAPFTAERAHADFGGGWPSAMRAEDGTWYGFALRARVIAYDTRKIDSPPLTLRDLAEPSWRGKVGIARPLFGTTVGHVAALVHLWGEGPTRSWLEAMKANDVRLYDSNSAVVRAIADGEIELALTDTDDVWVGQANGWPVGLAYEVSELPAGVPLVQGEVPPLSGFGPLTIPNTVARVAGGPNSSEAAELIEFLISAEGERLIMGSDSRNVPLRADLASELAAAHPQTVIESPAQPDLAGVAADIEAARDLAREVLGL
ncbi:MAG: extracellular solute-binding protein [Planctomycetota bacterium]